MTATAPVRILYMEDDPGLARLLKKQLERSGYLVDTAANGEEGLEKLTHAEYAAVLIDYHMPVCSGIEVIRIMAGRGSHPPAIMVTGNGNEKVAVEALRLGASDYIVKDVDMGYLQLLPMVIEKVLVKERLLREKELMFAVIRENEERYRRLVELSPDGIAVELDNRFEFINPAGAEILGATTPLQLLGKSVINFVHPDYRNIFKEHNSLMAKGGDNVPWLEEKFIRIDKNEVEVEVSGVPFNLSGKPAIQIIFRDITERNLARQRLEHMAHYDTLTGLPNRTLFFDRLGQSLREAKRFNNLLAILFVDLDRFKAVNDNFGHDVGDLLLKEAADRIQECVRTCDTVSRIGGDEFAIILTNINEELDAELVANRIIASAGRPFQLKENECLIGASIGISIFPFDGEDADTLLKSSDMAMYHAKETGKNRYHFHTKHQPLSLAL